jgi:Na+/alanine symporter
VFGAYGGWLVSFLSISFGLGVLVSYVYVTRAAWSYVTNHRFMYLFMAVYAVCACAGALATVDVVWYLADIIIAAMLFVNLYGLLVLLPRVKNDILKQLRDYKA